MTIPLVVGVDGSEASLEAVDWAADEAVRHGVPLHLLHAAPRDHEVSDVIGHASERAVKGTPTVRLSSEVPHDDAASAIGVEEGEGSGTAVQFALREAQARRRPRQALLEAASEVDLLVVGARRRQGQLGLTNHALLHHAPCTTAVVPKT
ncbi:universal stress protein [Streptomyces afghaniensis]|uniref:universal stress protein n=1 Tax=Streptomyces afghaniensis TaxID=66865 RepID=UPI00278574F9|nr:universal stress protein [Streptomyces afghaniensis]MDQ1013972.1 nucleotide-binding universal stress UspA family protein [Streptomyces afghaniensis]